MAIKHAIDPVNLILEIDDDKAYELWHTTPYIQWSYQATADLLGNNEDNKKYVFRIFKVPDKMTFQHLLRYSRANVGGSTLSIHMNRDGICLYTGIQSPDGKEVKWYECIRIPRSSVEGAFCQIRDFTKKPINECMETYVRTFLTKCHFIQ